MERNHEDFRLESPAAHLMTLSEMARSFNVSRQGFHAWGIQPVRKAGSRSLYNFANVLQNRLAAAQEADTPADSEVDRLQARIDLLREQIERQKIFNEDAAAEYVPTGAAEDALGALMTGVADVLNRIPDDLCNEFPKVRPARALLDQETRRCIRALHEAKLESREREPEE